MNEQQLSKTSDVYAYVICKGGGLANESCGQVPLTEEEFDRQLSRPDTPWVCPKCGGGAWFDDEAYERLHGIE